MIRRPTPKARVVLPSPIADIDTDEEVGENSGEIEEIDDGDFLADFPDSTEACVVYFRCQFTFHLKRDWLGTRVGTLSHWVFGRSKTHSILCTPEETLSKAELCFCA